MTSPRRQLVLGINAAYHQPSACLVLPLASIHQVLRAGGARLDDIDLIGTGFSPAGARP